MEAARAWRLWGTFAWHDLLSRYRRSWLGPLWLMLTVFIFISALSIIYSTLFRQPITEYVPFVALGVVCWAFISAIAGEGAMTFVEAETYIRQARTNLFIYVLRVFWRNTLVFLHQFAVALGAVVLLSKLSVGLLPLAALGLALMFAQALWVIPLLGLIGARFRDLQPIITNALQLLFFVTPVIWMPEALGSRRWIADLNPLSSLISLVRDPLLGHIPPVGAYAHVAMITIFGFAISAAFYSRFRARVIYWL